MKTHIHWLFILSTLLISCGQNPRRVQENKLEKHFERYVVRKQYVKRIESTNTSAEYTISYFIGYDSLNRIVNNENYQFYEYDSLGRISKQYQCVLSRDPTCSKPFIFFYEYSNGNLVRIKFLNTFANDSVPRLDETFLYDNKNRLVEHTKFPTDTITCTYVGNDTCKHSEIKTYWWNNFNDKWVKVSEWTIFQHDSLGRKTSLTWGFSEDGAYKRTDFFYDSNNRLVMERDTSLYNFIHVPNSCCILYWTNYKYDNQGRLIEEVHSTGSYDNPIHNFNGVLNFNIRLSSA